VASGATLREQIESAFSNNRRTGANLSGRLSWRLSEGGDSLALMPTLFHTVADNRRTFSLVQPIGSTPPDYDSGASQTDSAFTNGRLNLMWRQRLGGSRLELNGGLGAWRARGDTQRQEFTVAGGSTPVRTIVDTSRTRQQSVNLNGKLSTLLGSPPATGPSTGPGSATVIAASPAAGLRTVDRGELPTGPGLEALWHWVLDTSALHRLVPPSLTEQVSFTDAAVVATPEVIRHRVLRSAAVLERLPTSLEVKLARRREALPAESAMTATVSGTVPVVRLVACFPTRDGTPGDLRIVVWDSERRPGLVELLRDCARRLDPGATR
jgi:hypothetical protein